MTQDTSTIGTRKTISELCVNRLDLQLINWTTPQLPISCYTPKNYLVSLCCFTESALYISIDTFQL